MKHVFPSVKPRRLGTRGNSRYCYSGLKKKVNIKPPMLLDLNNGDAIYDGFRNEESNEMDNAACHIIFEWAEKLLSKKFFSIKELAIHLVENLYIGTSSDAALSLLTSSSQNKNAGILHNTSYKQTNMKKRKQSQVQPQKKVQEFNKEQKKKHKMLCVDTASLGTENSSPATLQQSDFQIQELKIPNAHKTTSSDTQNNNLVKELSHNSHISSVVPSTSQVPFAAEQFSNIKIGTKTFNPSTVTTDGLSKEVTNDAHKEKDSKETQKFLRSKSLEFKKLDYETAIYNLFNQCDTVADENLFEPSKYSAEVNRKQLRTDLFDTSFVPLVCNLKSTNNNFQTSNVTTGHLSSKIDSTQKNVHSESLTSQNSKNIQMANRNKKTDLSQLSQLRMLLEKNFVSPVNKSKMVDIHKAQTASLNQESKAETLKPFYNMEEQWKKENFHSAKLSLMAETYNRSINVSKDVQELNNEKQHFNSTQLLPNASVSQKALMETLTNMDHINNDMSLQSKSIDFMPVPMKEINRQHNLNASNPISNEIFNPILINTQETFASALDRNPKEIYNYNSPSSPFPFPQEALPLPSPGRPRHHSSHNIGHTHGIKNYNKYLLRSRSRHLSGPTYSKCDIAFETGAYDANVIPGNENSQLQAAFSPLHVPVSSVDFQQNSIYAQGMLNKTSQPFMDVGMSQQLDAESRPNDVKMQTDSNQLSPLLISNRASNDFPQSCQELHPIKQPNLNRCQSVPPHKMLQMLIDQNSPVHSPMISKSYPTTPVVNQIFQFPVSQSYQYEPNLSQMESSKLLTENNRDIPEVLMEGWHSSGNVCHSSMTELLEQPLDELQTTLEDLRDCDEFAQHLENINKK